MRAAPDRRARRSKPRRQRHNLPSTIGDVINVKSFWGAVENLNISGGEPTTRNDLPEMVEMFQRRLPRLRKIGINTTGLTPHRAIPMLTRIVEFCAEQGSADQHPRLARRHRRHPQPSAPRQARLRQGVQDHRGHAGAAAKHPNFPFGIAATIFATNLEDAKNILAWARAKKLDVVFNMLRFTDNMLGNGTSRRRSASGSAKKSSCASSSSSASRRNRSSGPGVHVPALRRHDRQRLSPDDAVPVPVAGPAAQPERRLFYCENSQSSATSSTTSAERLYFRAENLAHRERLEERRSARPA